MNESKMTLYEIHKLKRLGLYISQIKRKVGCISRLYILFQ